MKIHEYQAKAILARYGVTTPRGEVAFTKEEAAKARIALSPISSWLRLRFTPVDAAKRAELSCPFADEPRKSLPTCLA